MENFLLDLWEHTCGFSWQQWAGMLSISGAVGLAVYLWLSRRAPAEVTEWDTEPVYTRKQDMARWLRNEITLDEYLDLHRETPPDGSLAREQKRPSSVNVWFPITERVRFDFKPAAGTQVYDFKCEWMEFPCERESTVLRRCSMMAHPGQRISAARVRPGFQVPAVFQPSIQAWVSVPGLKYDRHDCCLDYVWVRSVNGKVTV